MVTQYILPVLAWAQYALDELDQAAATAAETTRLALVQALRGRALVLLAQQRYAEAACSLEEGLAVAHGMPFPHGEGRLLHVHGLLHAQQGEVVQARVRLESARGIFERLGARPDSERTEHLLAMLG
jgi:hypothetical protein